ncbi:unnamed protein product [Urochloa decumbens]|uniref:DUF1618 domain-containing protein n=1 Tax=Urochloa decumbens TaxID=240449 RepID=A0ABC8Y4Q9_9POAL
MRQLQGVLGQNRNLRPFDGCSHDAEGNKTGGSSSMPKRQRRMEKPRHLYLVLDDWPWGYGIRELDLLSDSDADDHHQLTPAERSTPTRATSRRHLPAAIFRFEAERSEPSYFAGAFGSKILATQPIVTSGLHRRPLDDGVPVYDVRARSFMLGPRRWTTASASPVVYVSAGGMLLALAAGDGGFEVLQPPPRDEAGWEGGFTWAWRRVPGDLPFRPEDVACHAVHPDGKTLFVSVVGGGGAADTTVTLSFDTAEIVIRNGDDGEWISNRDDGGCEWKRRGQWRLPFAGRGYYDRGLDAWVGLSGDPGTIGHLCSCDVVPTYWYCNDDDGHKQCPAVKIGQEKLFSEEEESGDEAVTEEKVPERFIRVMTFSMRYDKSRDLTSVNSRRLRYYSVPEEVTEPMLEHPVAFWM